MFITTLVRSALAYPLHAWRTRRSKVLFAAAMREADAGDAQRALRTLARAAALEPRNVAIRAAAGRLHAEAQAYGAARASFEQLLSFAPDYAEGHTDLATVCRLAGDYEAAETGYRRALSLSPGNTVARDGLALVLLQRRSPVEALEYLRDAHRERPRDGGTLKLLVETLVQLGAYAEACETARAVLDAPSPPYEAWLSLGLVYRRTYRSAQALACYEEAAKHRAGDVEVITNRAIALQNLGRLDEAFAGYEAALALAPDYALARFHRSLAYLLTGDYAAAWPDYETRLVSSDRAPRASVAPRWDGSPLRQRAVLVHSEQGIGDEILFASCLPDLLREAGACAIECAPKLRGLFQNAFPQAHVYAAGDANGQAAAIGAARPQVEVPLGSLPLHYRGTLADFPSHTGYLRADSRRVDAWRARLESFGPGLKIGISWRGGTEQSGVALRSIALDRWAPVLALSGPVHFVSLQYTGGAAAETQALHERGGPRVAHWPEAIDDYEETAALVAALDLTITVCTAVFDLAGALARPVWAMVPRAAEWRYGNAGEAIPWYPSARIFRQGPDAEWAPVLERVAAALRTLEGEARTSAPARRAADARGCGIDS
jgi:tetratricopeptide (TPR) repeat protein